MNFSTKSLLIVSLMVAVSRIDAVPQQSDQSPCTRWLACLRPLQHVGSTVADSFSTVIQTATSGLTRIKNYLVGTQAALEPHTGSKEIVQPRTMFFARVMGMTEDEFCSLSAIERAQLIKQVSTSDGTVTHLVRNSSTGAWFAAGTYAMLRLGDIRCAAATKLGERSAQSPQGTFSIREAGSAPKELPEKFRRYLDIGAMQAAPENRGALFAVASNFNALETVGNLDYDEASGQKKLMEYPYDMTQGPFASISAAPGVILRHYYAWYDGNPANGLLWQQSLHNEMNLLGLLGITVENGYIMDPLETLYDKIVASQNNGENFAIGYHKGIEVTGGFMLNKKNSYSVHDKDQLIDQAFVAALPIDYESMVYTGPCYAYKDQKVQAVAQKILDWSYEALLKAAFVQGKKLVYLTRIGGGAFNNNPDWVDEALYKQAAFIKQSGMTVILNNYDMSEYPLHKASASRRKLIELVQETGGRYERLYKGRCDLIVQPKTCIELPISHNAPAR